MIKVTRAAQEQKDTYEGDYPLHGFVTIDHHECFVEDKKAYFGELDGGECRYEVVAPEGFYFEPYGTRTVLCESIAHVKEVAAATAVCIGNPEDM